MSQAREAHEIDDMMAPHNPDLASQVERLRHNLMNLAESWLLEASGGLQQGNAEEWEEVARWIDTEYYLSQLTGDDPKHVDPVQHYIDVGWREMRDPSPAFSTRYYLERYPEIRRSGLNPLVHFLRFGRSEGRAPLPYATTLKTDAFAPKVSVIVPNYNHARFLPERLDSILRQTYQNLEILVLDDKSTDDSVDVIRKYADRYPEKFRVIFNDQNSGRVFRQWRKGIEEVTGDLVWICESDDTCEPDFLAQLVPSFADPSLMIAFGRIQFVDQNGVETKGLDGYRESAAPGIWAEPRVDPAHKWFRGPFGVRNIIPNVGGCVFRRVRLPENVWRTAESYEVLGDWFLYSHFANGGRIAYNPLAKSYFRHHGANTSVQRYRSSQYYIEHSWIAQHLRSTYGVPDETVFAFYRFLSDQFERFFPKEDKGRLSEHINLGEILERKQEQRHILVAILGFHLGGAEVFPIHLANQLLADGFIVSVLVTDPRNANVEMRQLLDPRIAVYEKDLVEEMGLQNFLDSAGVDVVSSHNITAEFFFFTRNSLSRPPAYVVTLHGSYEVTQVPDAALLRFLRGVSCWVATADKNLGHLKGLPIAQEAVTKLPNALIVEHADFPLSREELGIAKDDLVFGIASRAIREKGWEEAIEALNRAQEASPVRLVLLLCGTGPEADRLAEIHGDHPNVRFLGFHSNIHGFYRICDCCVLPTFFGGESFPLTLVQALQVGVPIIATGLGEIGSMLVVDERRAGIVLPWTGNTSDLTRDLAAAMLRMADPAFRSKAREESGKIGEEYDIAKLSARYAALFARVGGWAT